MKKIVWKHSKVKELNSWIEDNSASSYGATTSELQQVVDHINSGGIFIFETPENSLNISLSDIEAFKIFMKNYLDNGGYFITGIGKLNF